MSTETRTTSSTGGQKGVKPQRLSLLPREALEKISEVYAFGEQKYAAHNWRKGYEWSKSYDALQRHILAFWSGETNDPETGLPHLAHAGFHVFALLTWLQEQGEGGQFDDRYRPEPDMIVEEAWDQTFDEAQQWNGPNMRPLFEMRDRAIREFTNAQLQPQFSIGTDGTVTSLFKDPVAEARAYMEERTDEFAAALAKAVDEQPTMPEFPRVVLDKFVRVHPIDPEDPHAFPLVNWLTEAAQDSVGRNRG